MDAISSFWFPFAPFDLLGAAAPAAVWVSHRVPSIAPAGLGQGVAWSPFTGETAGALELGIAPRAPTTERASKGALLPDPGPARPLRLGEAACGPTTAGTPASATSHSHQETSPGVGVPSHGELPD